MNEQVARALENEKLPEGWEILRHMKLCVILIHRPTASRKGSLQVWTGPDDTRPGVWTAEVPRTGEEYEGPLADLLAAALRDHTPD